MMPYTTIHPAMHEEVVHTNQIPLSEFVDHFDSFAGRSFPSHWHHELEIQLIVKGRAKYNVNGTNYSVEEGSAIKAGEIIATLDDSRYRIARDQAASQVAVAEAQLALLLAGSRSEEIDVARARLKAAEANLVLSDKTCKRHKAMGQASSALARDQACYKASADKAARDEAKRTLEMLLAGTRAEEIEVARATVKQTQTQLADAQRALNNCALYAPADGVIRSRLKEPGDMVNATSPVYEMALMNPLWARVYIE